MAIGLPVDHPRRVADLVALVETVSASGLPSLSLSKVMTISLFVSALMTRSPAGLVSYWNVPSDTPKMFLFVAALT